MPFSCLISNADFWGSVEDGKESTARRALLQQVKQPGSPRKPGQGSTQLEGAALPQVGLRDPYGSLPAGTFNDCVIR